jgi:hypothetical protein
MVRPFRFRVRFYLLVPEPGPVGVKVEPLGEAFGPSVLPEGLAVLFGLVTAPPAPEPVVVPFVDEPVVVPLAAEPPAVELPPAEPPEEPPLCASANVLDSAKAVASAIVASFIVVFLFSDDWITAANDRSFRKKLAFRATFSFSRFTSPTAKRAPHGIIRASRNRANRSKKLSSVV